MTNYRAKFRTGLCGLYLPFYDALCAALGEEWQPYYGERSFVAQDALYAQGRTLPGGRVTNARGGESAHEYGCATDWTKVDSNGVFIWLKKEDTTWAEYEAMVTKVGLRPGSEFGDVDHNEMRISKSWKNDVLPAYKAGGMDAAYALIAANIV